MTIRRHAIFVFAAVALLPATAAQAQWYSSVDRKPPPLYPYAAPAQQTYAVQVAPNTYVIHRPDKGRSATRHRAQPHKQASAAPVAKHRHSKVDPALIEELRKRPRVERPVVNTTQVVQEKPIVHETTRYVDDPPRVVERRRYADGSPAHSKAKRVAAAEASAGAHIIRRNGGIVGGNEKRVISADAEITILGPDRMSIRLFRKGDGPKAEAPPNKD